MVSVLRYFQAWLGLSFLVMPGFAYAQADSLFIDQKYHYSISIPRDWTWEKIDKPDSPMRVSVTSPDDKNNFGIIVFESQKSDVALERLAMVFESDPEMKKTLGERISHNAIKRYGLDVIEKRYKRSGFFKTTYTTTEYLAKWRYGYVFLYSSESEDDTWQNAFRQSLVFSFPESTGSKMFRYSALIITLLFLYGAIRGAAEPYAGKKSLAFGLTSISALRKRSAEITHQKQEHQRLDTHLKNRQETLHKAETDVKQRIEQYWSALKTYITVKKQG